MLQELSHMDRITQLQDEIQQLLTIMSATLAHLTSRANFVQLDGSEIPITKQRNPEKYDEPEVFDANKKELVTDLIVKAKQVEYLIQSLPEPEPEEEQEKRLKALDEEMTLANEEYIQAVARSKDLHAQVSGVLRVMLEEKDSGMMASRKIS
ncbi:mediator of RNA polymerase II transcription subunit 21 [Favolaschia claudopus]|uniref:Mediator of RNA polymerase II transcription subunit 21 n=1 Tax=Favolaschia claudopus TaxID=2862362 RepID=A0AAW0BBZ6_9AGAR